MANNRKRDLLFFIENEVQFESLRPLLVYIKKNKLVSFDILIPSGGSSEAVNLKVLFVRRYNMLLYVVDIQGEPLAVFILCF